MWRLATTATASKRRYETHLLSYLRDQHLSHIRPIHRRKDRSPSSSPENPWDTRRDKTRRDDRVSRHWSTWLWPWRRCWSSAVPPGTAWPGASRAMALLAWKGGGMEGCGIWGHQRCGWGKEWRRSVYKGKLHR